MHLCCNALGKNEHGPKPSFAWTWRPRCQNAGLIVPVLLGSVRPERQAVRVGRMLMN